MIQLGFVTILFLAIFFWSSYDWGWSKGFAFGHFSCNLEKLTEILPPQK